MADKPRAKARRAAALTRPVKLLDDPSKMTPEDRVRYFLGLPQGYPVNPEHWRTIQSRLMARYASRDPSPGNIPWGREVTRLRDAPMPQLSRALGMVKPSELAYQGAVPVRGHSEGGQGAYLTPFEMLLLKDTMGDELPGARQEGESLQQARQRVARSHDIYAEDRERLRQLWDAQAQEAARSGYTPGPGEPGVQSMPDAAPGWFAQRAREQFYPAGGPPWSREQLEEIRVRRQKARQDAAKRPQNPRMGPVKRKHGGGY